MVTPAIIHSEFIGVEASIAKSRHPGYLNIFGTIIDETRNTFKILHNGKRKTVIKHSAIFNFNFSDGSIVEIDGKLLVGRPEDRMKKRIRRRW